MSNFLDQLNEVQREAVTHMNGPLLVVAGPGSGKTRVLTYRIAHLINSGVAPWEILALTFTNKAAREMKDRIEQVVGPQAQKVWAGTFHSIFARILRTEAQHIGYPSSFTIYDTDDSKSLLSDIIKRMGLIKEDYKVNTVRSRISAAKSKLITPKIYAEDPVILSDDLKARRPKLKDIYAEYVKRCKKAGAMDFDDLLYRLYELLQNHPDVRKKYQDKFRYILVDEFQDTNTLQYEILLKLLDYRKQNGEVDQARPRNITVVGDDAQSIYAFRGATIENILHFEKDFQAYNIKTYKLEQNYRSTSHIVDAANELIIHNKNQIPKKIWSDKGSGSKIKVMRAMTDAEEGRLIAGAILEQKTRNHLRNQDIAILYRTNAQSRIFEEHLRKQNLIYKVIGGVSFYQRKEVKDLLVYLRLVVNHNDEEALRRVLNYPRRGIGKSTIDKILTKANTTGHTMWDCLDLVNTSSRARNSITAFKNIILKAASKLDTHPADVLARDIYQKSGLKAFLVKDTSLEGIGRLENMASLLDGITEFVENDELETDATIGDKSLRTYLQNIALITDVDQSELNNDYITLMSVHAAKGLEFKSVFIVGLEDDLFPSKMAKDDPEGIDEERRLFYVAITRAERYLSLSFANSRYRFGNMTYSRPSPFLNEIDRTHLDADIGIQRPAPDSGRQRSGVQGNFVVPKRRKAKVQMPQYAVDPKTFQPSPTHNLAAGMDILHLKFGEGKVISVDGAKDNRVATIAFKELGNEQKRIMLRFAKIQILN